MRYRIEYADGRYCNFANGRAELLKWLKLLKQEEISDIRKVYKSGVSDSVLETYRNYMFHIRSHIHSDFPYLKPSAPGETEQYGGDTPPVLFSCPVRI